MQKSFETCFGGDGFPPEITDLEEKKEIISSKVKIPSIPKEGKDGEFLPPKSVEEVRKKEKKFWYFA